LLVECETQFGPEHPDTRLVRALTNKP
jgi:hypothetical protein